MSMFLSLVLWLLLGWVTSYFAQQRGRDPIIWFLVGMFLGIIGLLLLFILPAANRDEEKDALNPDQTFDQNQETIELQPHSVQAQPEYTLHDWFYIDRDRQQKGPMGFSELKKLWNEEQISPLTYVWHEGMAAWQKIEEIADLRNALS